MVSDSVLLTLKNRKSQKHFILVEDELPGRQVRVINPSGNAIIMPRELFESAKCEVAQDDFEQVLTTDQLAGLVRYRERVRSAAEQARLSERNTASTVRVSSTRARTTRRTAKTPIAATGSRSGGIVDRWTSQNLVFYRHKIHPLRPADRFAIMVEGQGEFVMSKDEFERYFNDVVMSPKYRSEGMFSYPSPPERALQFLKKS